MSNEGSSGRPDVGIDGVGLALEPAPKRQRHALVVDKVQSIGVFARL